MFFIYRIALLREVISITPMKNRKLEEFDITPTIIKDEIPLAQNFVMEIDGIA